MADLLAKKLDASQNWDLSAIKSKLPSMSGNAMKTYLGGTEKPSTWGAEPGAVGALDGIAMKLAATLGITTEDGMIKQIDADGNQVSGGSLLSRGVMLDPSKPGDVTAAQYMAAAQNLSNSAAGVKIIALAESAALGGATSAKKETIKGLIK